MASLDALTAEPVDRKAVETSAATEWSEWLSALLERLQREKPENCWLLCQHVLEGRSIQELADETNQSANEIRCRIYRAMEKLRLWNSQAHPHGEKGS